MLTAVTSLTPNSILRFVNGGPQGKVACWNRTVAILAQGIHRAEALRLPFCSS
jgi:hypothetical protein